MNDLTESNVCYLELVIVDGLLETAVKQLNTSTQCALKERHDNARSFNEYCQISLLPHNYCNKYFEELLSFEAVRTIVA